MKRRRFFSVVAGLCAAPALAVLPKFNPVVASVDVTRDFITVTEARMADLTAYELAEQWAADVRAIAAGMGLPYEKLARDFSEGSYQAIGEVRVSGI